MSMSLSAGQLATSAATGAMTVTVATTAAAVQPSMWSILVLGIPLGVLAAALGGAAVRSLREPAAADEHIPGRVLAILCDGFIGGWVAMMLVGLPFTQSYIGPVVRAEVVGAICALLVQFVRDNGKPWLEQAFKALLKALVDRFAARRGGEP